MTPSSVGSANAQPRGQYRWQQEANAQRERQAQQRFDEYVERFDGG